MHLPHSRNTANNLLSTLCGGLQSLACGSSTDCVYKWSTLNVDEDEPSQAAYHLRICVKGGDDPVVEVPVSQVVTKRLLCMPLDLGRADDEVMSRSAASEGAASLIVSLLESGGRLTICLHSCAEASRGAVVRG